MTSHKNLGNESISSEYLDILIRAESSGAAIKQLQRLRKEELAHFSIGYMARISGASRGYIADVMSGRRILNPRYWDSFVSLLRLDFEGERLLQLLLAIDFESDDGEKAKLKKELDRLRKSVAVAELTMPSRSKNLFFAFEVFCAFGLFKNSPTLKDLKGYFGVSRGVELGFALQVLVDLNVVAKDGERWVLTENMLSFGQSEDSLSYYDFLRDSLEKAKLAVGVWADNGQQSIFESTLISVSKADYEQVLPTMLSNLHRMQADLETDEGDQLIRFNVQIYPYSD